MGRKIAIVLVVALMVPFVVFAQTGTISGTVIDKDTKEALPGANVAVKGTSFGAVTDVEGKFNVSVPAGTYIVRVSMVGYETVEVPATISGDAAFTLHTELKSVAIEQAAVEIVANRAVVRETPVAFTEVTSKDVEQKLASRDVPMILNTTPSVYATQTGGGAGDARINVRGFNQRNFAVMINGVPVNDMENGWVYWSNWAGLGDVTSFIQVQRGLGATPYSVSSIGGLLNVQTTSSQLVKKSRVRTESGSDNLRKVTSVFSTGVMDNGYAVSGMFARKTGDGYADRLWTDEFTYFLSVSRQISHHAFDFSVIGSPQRHGQRFVKQKISSWAARGDRYNSGWGYLNGKEFDSAINFYHKPQITFTHNWQISEKSFLSNILYASFGTGGGTGFLGTFPSTTSAGLLNMDAIWTTNTTNIDSTISTTEKRSRTIFRASRNNHSWYGFLSTLKHNLTGDMILTTGIDARYYKGEHYRTIENLIGGDYYRDTANQNRDPDTQLRVGDKVGYWNDGLVYVGGTFGQLEYKKNKLSSFVNLSLSSTGYKRVDYFLAKVNGKTNETDWNSFLGYTSKVGANYNLDESNNVFVNAGYFSKAPIFDNVYTFANTKYQNIENEKIYAFESGYGYRSLKFAAVINGFYTIWKDKAVNKIVYDSLNQEFDYSIPGLDALHRGIELELRYLPAKQLEFNGMFSYSVNEWKNNVTAEVSPETDPTDISIVKIVADGLFVGDFPMTTAALGFTYNMELNNGARAFVNPVYQFFGRQYSDFDPDKRSVEAPLPWQVPDYTVLNIHAGYTFNFKNSHFRSITVAFHLFNAMNNRYISDATDGSSHTSLDATVFYGRERNYNASVTFDF